jgi:hypothetical protein
VSATGGAAEAITALGQDETAHSSPHFLPDGRHYLYSVWSSQPSNRAIYAGSLDSKERIRLISAESMTAYADPGQLLFQRQGALFAQPFDPQKLQVTGEPVRVADQLMNNTTTGRSAFSVSRTGTLIYRSDSGGSENNAQFSWFDRSGKQLGLAGKPGEYVANFDLSADGKRIVAVRAEAPVTCG